MTHTLLDSADLGLKPSYSGKVRDLFDLGERLIIVTLETEAASPRRGSRPAPEGANMKSMRTILLVALAVTATAAAAIIAGRASSRRDADAIERGEQRPANSRRSISENLHSFSSERP